MTLRHDIILDDNAFKTASSEMLELKKRATELKKELESMYQDLTTALDTPAGKKVRQVAKEVLIKPIDDLLLVIKHISDTLTEIIGTKYYEGIFIQFNALNTKLKF